MHTTDSTKENPQFYFLQSGVDGEGNPIYDLDHQEDTGVANGKGLITRAKTKAADPDTPVNQMANARIESITGQDHFFVDLYYDGDLAATWELQPQYWHVDHWEDQEITGTIEIDNALGQMTCSGVQGGFSWDVVINFTRERKKWEWHVVAPGFLMRAVWTIDFTSLGQQLRADGDLRLDYGDYDGNVSDDEGVATRTIIFEPDGVSDEWDLDPYLRIDEPTNYIDVYADGWVFRCQTNTTWT